MSSSGSRWRCRALAHGRGPVRLLLRFAVAVPCVLHSSQGVYALCTAPSTLLPSLHSKLHHPHSLPLLRRMDMPQMKRQAHGTRSLRGGSENDSRTVVEMVSVRLDVGGMKCGGCVGRVRSLLQEAPGVLNVAVSLPAAMAVVSLDQKQGDARHCIQVLQDQGFTAAQSEHGKSEAQAHADRGARQAAECRMMLSAVQLILMLNLPSIAFVVAPAGTDSALMWLLHKLALQSVVSIETARSIVGLVQASTALLTVGRRFYRSSYAAVRAGFANMDVLIALGLTSSFIFSSAAMVLGG